MQELDIASIWGKSRGLERPYPLPAHLLDTAAIANELLGTVPSDVADQICSIFAESSDPLAMAAAFAGAHDLGKASPTFQSQDPGAGQHAIKCLGPPPLLPNGGSRHDHITQLTLPEAAASLGFELEQSASAVSGLLGVSCALGGHHGVFAQVEMNERFSEDRHQIPFERPETGNSSWADARALVLAELFRTLGVTPARVGGRVDQLVLFAGLAVVSDWLASQESLIVGLHGGKAKGSWYGHYAATRAVAPEILADAGIRATRRRSVTFAESFGFEPNAIQRDIARQISRCPGAGFLAVTVPMGAGKTEAALDAARLMGGSGRGLFFALPTMATADAMFERLLGHVARAFDGAVEASLLHGHAGLHEGYLGLPRSEPGMALDSATHAVASAWLRGRGRTMLSSVSAGTIDQLLSAALPTRHGFLRWFGLAGKAVIIDEAHSLDAYMQRLLETALRWLGRLGVPVVVLSATMPQEVIGQLAAAWAEGAGLAFEPVEVPYPGWLHVSTHGQHVAAVPTAERSLHVDVAEVDAWDDTPSLCGAVSSALSPIETEGVALVVVNTVLDAQRTTVGLREWAERNDIELLCLHSRMRMRDRRRITESVVSRLGPSSPSRPKRLVVVATQVIEQSVDIDADIVVSALAPVAPLLQRAGRSHRHGRDRSHLHEALQQWRLIVLRPTMQRGTLAIPRGWSFIYPMPYLARTDSLLTSFGPDQAISVPGGVTRLVEAVYGELSDTDPDDAVEKMLLEQWGDRMVAARSTIPGPSQADSLHDLTSLRDDGMLATRLGTESIPVLVVDGGPTGLTLDGRALPPTPSRDDTRWLLDATVPLRRTRELVQHQSETTDLAPTGWQERALLRDVVMAVRLPDGTVTMGTNNFQLDEEIGWTQI